VLTSLYSYIPSYPVGQFFILLIFGIRFVWQTEDFTHGAQNWSVFVLCPLYSLSSSSFYVILVLAYLHPLKNGFLCCGDV
jgi:hypothetical protein